MPKVSKDGAPQRQEAGPVVDLRDDAQPGEPVAPTVPGYTLGARLGHGGGGSVWAATRETDRRAQVVRLRAP